MKFHAIFYAILFAVAHTQSPLYYSNQNQYFLHAGAQAGFGDLHSDWLANTADPTPVFTSIAAWSFRHLGSWPIQAVHFLAQMIYVLAAWWLIKPSARIAPAFAGVFILLHAGALRWVSYRLLGADYLWFFQCGLANQYILGPGLQPSVIGVMLLASAAAIQRGRTRTAILFAAGANVLHATYLLPAGMLVLGYLVVELRQKRERVAVQGAFLALAIVLPLIGYIYTTFPPNLKSSASAQEIIAQVRIPHHANPARWFDWAAGLQILWMIAGCWALRGTRLFVPVCLAFLLGTIGTLAVLATGNNMLALLFPWRISAILIPISTAAIIHNGLQRLAPTTPEEEATPMKSARVLLGSMAVLFCGLGAVVYAFDLGFSEPEGENAALEYVAQHAQPGDKYLIAARFPKPSSKRGVYSNTYGNAPEPTATVFFEMARFRLKTGAALYIDFKSIPYESGEVLEWNQRVQQCETWFRDTKWNERDVVNELRQKGITHVLVPKSMKLEATGLKLIFAGGAYELFQIGPAS